LSTRQATYQHGSITFKNPSGQFQSGEAPKVRTYHVRAPKDGCRVFWEARSLFAVLLGEEFRDHVCLRGNEFQRRRWRTWKKQWGVMGIPAFHIQMPRAAKGTGKGGPKGAPRPKRPKVILPTADRAEGREESPGDEPEQARGCGPVEAFSSRPASRQRMPIFEFHNLFGMALGGRKGPTFPSWVPMSSPGKA
jgi:hypothetical protein